MSDVGRPSPALVDQSSLALVAIGFLMIGIVIGHFLQPPTAPPQFSACELPVPEQIALYEEAHGIPGWPGEYVLCSDTECFKTGRAPAGEEVNL